MDHNNQVSLLRSRKRDSKFRLKNDTTQRSDSKHKKLRGYNTTNVSNRHKKDSASGDSCHAMTKSQGSEMFAVEVDTEENLEHETEDNEQPLISETKEEKSKPQVVNNSETKQVTHKKEESKATGSDFQADLFGVEDSQIKDGELVENCYTDSNEYSDEGKL